MQALADDPMSEERAATRAEIRAEQRRKALAELARLVREIGAEVITLIVIALPLLVRLMCTAAAVFGAAFAFGPLWFAFGADPIALIPAGALVLAPLAFTLAGGLSWGGLLLSGAVLFAAGGLVPLASPVVLDLMCAGMIGAACFQTLNNSGKETNNEQQTV